jgi:hypothetical protein
MLPSGLPEDVGDAEEVVRFLTASNHYRSNPARRVYYAAYLPNPADWETSVFRRDGFDAARMWVEADQVLSRRAIGVGLCTAAEIRKAEIEVVAMEPPPRHANLTRWPMTGDADDPDLRKARHREIALAIATAATLVLRE